MKRNNPPIVKVLAVTLVLLGLSGTCNAQPCSASNDDDLWDAGPGVNLPDHADFGWDDCRSEIDGTVEDLSPDGWVLSVLDDQGQGGGEDEDRSAYCKANVFSLGCQSGVFEIHVRSISGDSDPPHAITDIVLLCGLRDGTKDLTLVVSMEGVGFTDMDGTLDWLQIDDGNGGTMDAFVNLTNDTNDKQHLYRVEKDGTDTITLFVDQAEELSFDYDELANTALNQSHLATTSGPGEAEFRLRYYRHRIGSTEFQTESVGCDADFDSDDDVDSVDLLALLANWGSCPEAPATCPWDINGDDNVGAADLLSLLASWGPCT